MWVYCCKSGDFYRNGEYEGRGYSGAGVARNSPAWDNIGNIGPIPAGRYRIQPADHPHPNLKPPVLMLVPFSGTETYGRSGFLIHGNNADNDASHGCIILGPALRALIASSGDTSLLVSPTERPPA